MKKQNQIYTHITRYFYEECNKTKEKYLYANCVKMLEFIRFKFHIKRMIWSTLLHNICLAIFILSLEISFSSCNALQTIRIFSFQLNIILFRAVNDTQIHFVSDIFHVFCSSSTNHLPIHFLFCLNFVIFNVFVLLHCFNNCVCTNHCTWLQNAALIVAPWSDKVCLH